MQRTQPRADRPPAYEDVVRAFQEVGEAIVREVELDRLLHLVLHKVCDLVGVRRGSLYLLDDETGLFHGQVGFMEDTTVDDRIKRYRAGVPADRFTKEIVATRAPVLIADAQRDSRPVRSTMRAWNVRSILGVPMSVGDEVRGLMFLDDIEQPHDFSEPQQRLASAFADMAAVAITTAQRAEALAQSARTVARQNTLLRKAVAMEEQLTVLALRGGTVRDVISKLAELIDEPCAIHDAGFRKIAVGVPPGSEAAPPQLLDDGVRETPEVRAALEGLPDGDPKVLGPFPHAGVHRRHLVVPIWAREETWGHLLVVEANSRLRTMETLIASRAAAIIALNVTFRRSAEESDAYAREALLRRLIDAGTPSAAMAARAEFHGLRSGRPYVAGVVAGRHSDGERYDGDAVENAAQHAGLPAVWLAGRENGAVSFVVELPDPGDDLHDRFSSLAAHLDTSDETFVAVSEICDTVDELPAAHVEARRVMRILRTFATTPASPRILTARELGPAYLLLATTDRADADRFVRRALGSFCETENAKAAEVLQTLQAFIDASWGVRRAAAHLHMHENTVRYRLAKLTEETGRDVLADPRAQLDAQVALLILRLEGRWATAISS